MREFRSVLHAALLLTLWGCRRGELAAGVNDSTFVSVMTQLRTIEADTLLTSDARAAARKRALAKHGVTADALEQAARALADDPDRAFAVWREVDRRLTAPPTRSTK